MRPDQRAALELLSEQLADVLIEEINPDNWPAAHKPVREHTPEDRGDRHWCKKNAAGTMMLLTGITRLQDNTRAALGRDPYTNGELDSQIRKAEKEAGQAVARIMDGALKERFDRYTHGKRSD